jgi:hypothetical protein
MRVCPYCKRRLGRGRNGNPMATCGGKECQKALARDRKRKSRRKAADTPEPVPSKPVPAGPVVTPFGTYESADDAWIAANWLDTEYDPVGEVEPPAGYVAGQCWRQWWLTHNDVPLSDDPELMLGYSAEEARKLYDKASS